MNKSFSFIQVDTKTHQKLTIWAQKAKNDPKILVKLKVRI